MPNSFVAPWIVAFQAPLSIVAFPPPGTLPDPEIEPTSLTSPELACGFFTTCTTWEALVYLRS